MKDYKPAAELNLHSYEKHNPYAPPQSGTYDPAQGTSELRVEGDIIVSPKDCVWPDRCVVCNAPANGYRLKRSLFWHPPALYFLLALSWLIYLIVALIVRERGTIHIGLCEQHRQRRRNGILIGWFGTFASIALVIWSSVSSIRADNPFSAYLVAAGMIGIIGSIITGIVLVQNVRLKKIDATQIRVTVGDAFRRSIEWQQ
jgi:uncharacterized membrane protein